MTIFALSTAHGKAGIAIIRISGPHSLAILKALGYRGAPSPRTLTLHSFITPPPLTECIDRGVFVYFPAPHSFTGEDVVELHLHGGPAVVQKMLDTLGEMANTRLAEPGEFSKIAFRNGKMDLTEAEGIADLIDAETDAQRAQALKQACGHMHHQFMAWREQVLTALAHLEAYIDFPEEDIPDAVYSELKETVESLLQECQQCLQDHHIGERIRDGIQVAIVGPPNAGKSSLLNAIAKRDVAIVSHLKGTTRDVIEVRMDMLGLPVILSDTAGIRESSDVIEREGITRARQRAEEADVILAVSEWSESAPDVDFYAEWPPERTLAVCNKIDAAKHYVAETAFDLHMVSTKTGQGLDTLLEALATRIQNRYHTAEAPLITRARHRVEVERATECLSRFLEIDTLELQCEELRHAAKSIGRITGHIAVDDVLDTIFRSFCIGK